MRRLTKARVLAAYQGYAEAANAAHRKSGVAPEACLRRDGKAGGCPQPAV